MHDIVLVLKLWMGIYLYLKSSDNLQNIESKSGKQFVLPLQETLRLKLVLEIRDSPKVYCLESISAISKVAENAFVVEVSVEGDLPSDLSDSSNDLSSNVIRSSDGFWESLKRQVTSRIDDDRKISFQLGYYQKALYLKSIDKKKNSVSMINLGGRSYPFSERFLVTSIFVVFQKC